MADYLPHTEDDVASMLSFLGMESLDDLFAHIPDAVRLSGGLEMCIRDRSNTSNRCYSVR